MIRILAQAFPPAARTSDPNGMLPMHYMAQWGPSETKAIDALLFANQDTNVKDDQGNTPLHYAEEGDYPFRQEMIAALKNGPLSNIPKKKFQHALPPMSQRPTTTTTAHVLSSSPSNLSKLDDSSLSSNFVAPVRVVYNYPGSDATLNTSSSKLQSNSGGNKTVNRLTAQINKLKADLDYQTAEYEENLTNQREDHERKMEELNTKILRSIDDNNNVEKDIESKTEYGEYVQNRISEIEKDIDHFKEQNERIEKELGRNEEELRMEKSKAEAFQMRIRTLSSKMNMMIEDQHRIETSLASIEKGMTEAAERRKEKLRELYDEEVKYSKELTALKKVYGTGGPTILSSLSEQKNMMETCVLVLSECEDKENDPLA